MYAKTSHRYTVAAALVAVAIAAVAVAWPTQDKNAVVGVRTGEYENGVPVYRLPTVTVSVSRSEELAKMAREEPVAINAIRQ
jgi:hypothetical protein